VHDLWLELRHGSASIRGRSMLSVSHLHCHWFVHRLGQRTDAIGVTSSSGICGVTVILLQALLLQLHLRPDYAVALATQLPVVRCVDCGWNFGDGSASIRGVPCSQSHTYAATARLLSRSMLLTSRRHLIVSLCRRHCQSCPKRHYSYSHTESTVQWTAG